MTDAAILILAGTESHADLGRVTNALQTAKEFAEHGDDVEVIFDGAATQWIAELDDDSHQLNPLFESLGEHVSACDYCTGAFEVGDAVDDSAAERADEFEGHPSVRSLVDEGYEVITY